MTNHNSLNYCSPNRKVYLRDVLSMLLIVFTQVFFSNAQTVFQNFTANCGSPIAFTDPGGAGNYGNGLHYVYTICPGTASNYASVTFSSLNLGANDFISVINGNSSQDPFIRTLSSTNNTNTAFTITSSSTDRCLTLIFGSNNIDDGNSGWVATYNCVSTAGTNTNICQETDCVGGCARTVCGSGTYTWQNAGANMADLNNVNAGCLTAHPSDLERNHVWYYINPQSPGTLEVLINSGAGGQVYDFALWKSTGETITCPAFSGEDPFLCEAENNGSNGSTPQGTGFLNDIWAPGSQPYYNYPGFRPPVEVTAQDIADGVVFMLLINVRSNGSPQPVVNITMDGQLDCTPLTVSLIDFNGQRNGMINDIYWSTRSEQNNSHFIVERSMNTYEWEILQYVPGHGTTNETVHYEIKDLSPYYPITYYRLKQVDTDGEVTHYKTISISGEIEIEDWISGAFPNPTSHYMTAIYNGHDTETPLTIQIINHLGQIVYSEEKIPTQVKEGMSMDLSHLSQGLYILHFQQGDRVKTERIVVQK